MRFLALFLLEVRAGWVGDLIGELFNFKTLDFDETYCTSFSVEKNIAEMFDIQ